MQKKIKLLDRVHVADNGFGGAMLIFISWKSGLKRLEILQFSLNRTL